MRIFLIKHKGATIWQNLLMETRITIGDDTIFAGKYFARKKDADLYLNVSIYKDYYEVVGATVDISKDDNRKNKKKWN
jgi:hypothetical protein